MADVCWPERDRWRGWPEDMLITMADALEAAGLLADPDGLRVRVVQLETQLTVVTEHARSLHRLNGWSKQKGWWCSCGATIAARSWYPDQPQPWSLDGRSIAIVRHELHVDVAVAGSSLTPEEPTP